MSTSLFRLVLVEDDEALGFVIQDNLQEAGFEVLWEKDGLSALRTIPLLAPDLAVVDVMLPGLDGFGLVEQLRAAGQELAVLFLTAKSLKEDRIRGFRVGGDDYLIKPFSMEELVLRIRAILRRTRPDSQLPSASLDIGLYRLDYRNFKLLFGEQSQTLTQREADLLRLLLLYKNQVLSRPYILQAVWGGDDYFKGRSLDVFIARLRKYLSQDPAVRLVNLHGVGFRLEELPSEP
jgi:DNA-binding response OmpR family regulator